MRVVIIGTENCNYVFAKTETASTTYHNDFATFAARQTIVSFDISSEVRTHSLPPFPSHSRSKTRTKTLGCKGTSIFSDNL